MDDEAIFEHVKQTIAQYRQSITLEEFNKNLIDPIKLTFDAKVYERDIAAIVETESIRQIDKSNNNTIGYFHQHLFKYAGGGWDVPKTGFDIVNEDCHIYVEMKNKHNTMNAASSKSTYIKMQSQLLSNDQSTCLLVEAIAKRSQNIKWKISIDGKSFAHERIRRVSMDKFYEIVFGDSEAFFKLCTALPTIIDDVLATEKKRGIQNSVFEELSQLSPDLSKSLYLLAFQTYEGFNHLSP